MASNVSSSSTAITTTTHEEGARPQAGPLPQKRGEIGFRESVHLEEGQQNAEQEGETIPERHPADTPIPESPASASSSAPPAPDATPTDTVAAPTSPRPSDASSTKTPKHKILSFFQRKQPKFGGITIASFLRLFIQLFFFGGSLAAWIIITKRLLKTPVDDSSDTSSSAGGSGVLLGGSTSIFVHVTFAIAVLGQLLFLERCIYHMRAQRYAYKHPDSILPQHSGINTSNIGMGFAPWSRPPLPTYAATLAQSGLGTGDVEDNLIAIPPPPAYGNTRGSKLLLQGFLRNSLRDAITARRTSTDSDTMSDLSRPSRPVSYRSQDYTDGLGERSDAERAERLAETLQQLEDGNAVAPSSTHTHSPAR